MDKFFVRCDKDGNVLAVHMTSKTIPVGCKECTHEEYKAILDSRLSRTVEVAEVGIVREPNFIVTDDELLFKETLLPVVTKVAVTKG
jgi:hypothetical protein